MSNLTQVLDLYSPRWECLDDGSYTSVMPWLKQRATYSCFHGNKLYTLKPSINEKLWELQVCVVRACKNLCVAQKLSRCNLTAVCSAMCVSYLYSK